MTTSFKRIQRRASLAYQRYLCSCVLPPYSQPREVSVFWSVGWSRSMDKAARIEMPVKAVTNV